MILPLVIFGCEEPTDHTAIHSNFKDQSTVDEPEAQANRPSILEVEEENFEDRIDKFLHTPPSDDNHISFGSFRSNRPPSWFWTPPKSQVVAANYIVPSIDDREHAIFSVTLFDVGEGGLFRDNVTRWKSLFRSNDGAPVKPTYEVITVNGHDAIVAEFQGEYMGIGAAWHLKNHSLLVAEVSEPDGNIYFKLLGPTTTVDAHRPSFFKVLETVELVPVVP